MAVSLQLGIKQSQNLIMTQSLRQAIEMLQLSTIELSEKISAEILDNPVVEEISPMGIPEFSPGSKSVENLSTIKNDDFIREELRNSSESGDDSNYSYTKKDDDKKRQFIENSIAVDETLSEHLLLQAKLASHNEDEYFIFQSIITMFDDHGFLPLDYKDVVEDLDITHEKLKEFVLRINLFDPVGCGAKNVNESLLIQAGHFFPEDKILAAIILDYFTELENLDYNIIAKGLKISFDDVVEKSRLMQNLTPYPGSNYSSGKVKYIIPDLDVSCKDKDVIITLNDSWLPEIRINSYYIDILKKKNIEKKHLQYIQDKIVSAKSLLSNINTRRETILKTVSAIMFRQKEFVEKGPGYLKPLTHSDIAMDIGMHESTVSRVTSNKYVQTKWGVFELKYFFISKLKSLNSNNHDDQSSDRVRSIILEMIEREDSENPLKDLDIVAILAEKNISIARRTVAKYRDILKIPSSSRRKKINLIRKKVSL